MWTCRFLELSLRPTPLSSTAPPSRPNMVTSCFQKPRWHRPKIPNSRHRVAVHVWNLCGTWVTNYRSVSRESGRQRAARLARRVQLVLLWKVANVCSWTDLLLDAFTNCLTVQCDRSVVSGETQPTRGLNSVELHLVDQCCNFIANSSRPLTHWRTFKKCKVRMDEKYSRGGSKMKETVRDTKSRESDGTWGWNEKTDTVNKERIPQDVAHNPSRHKDCWF